MRAALLLALLPALPAQQAPAPHPFQARLGELLAAQRERHGFPGACAAVVLPDGTLVTAAAGAADREGKQPLSEASRLMSGSIGKTYCAAIALQLVAEGKLSLDGKFADVLGKEEWYPRLPNAAAITLRQLLNHTSGVPEHVWKQPFQDAITGEPDRVWTPRECVAFILGDPPAAAAGEKWRYADTNYVLVGLAIEQVTGKPFYEVLQERLLAPLQLRDTVPNDRRDVPGLVNGHASGVAFHSGDTVVDGRYFVNPIFEYCGGGISSTAGDLARWTALLFGGEVIPKDLRDDFVAGVPAGREVGGKYGLGCFVTRGVHGPAFGHSGIMPGYLGYTLWFPDLRIAAALLCNTDDGKRAGPMQRHVEAYAAAAKEWLALPAGK
ncbi:MAG: beta-lactamase family protein [Planctomycetes bacterium]|nr:beta-lactamase family protein [Planctomycetota bacterium]